MIKMSSNVKFTVSVSALVLLSISLFGGLFLTVLNLNSENANLQNQITKLQDFVGANNPSLHLRDEATVMDTLKRLTRQSGSSQSAIDLLADALTELIEKKLYTIMKCARNDDNLTDCSLKPGPKGNSGPQGEPGVKGNIGYPGHSGEVGPKGPTGDPGPMGYRGVKGDTGEIGRKGHTGVKGERGENGVKGHSGHKGDSGEKGDRGYGGNKGQKGEKGAIAEQGSMGTATAAVTMETTQLPTTGAMTTQPPTIPSERCGGPGWRKVAFIDMTDTSQNCPQGLREIQTPIRTCGRAHTSRESCSSVTITTRDYPTYSRVCGRAKAYQKDLVSSFWGYNIDGRTLHGAYVDGLSITHGTQRSHIWTFAAGRYQITSGSDSRLRCPCYEGNTYGAPPFIGNDYFCESGAYSAQLLNFHSSNPLWDGEGCISDNSCCKFNHPPWFMKTLPVPTNDNIEMRLCLENMAADIAIEQVELYVF